MQVLVVGTGRSDLPLVDTLLNHGIIVSIASSDGAAEKFNRVKPDIVLVTIEGPLHTAETIEKIVEIDPDARIVAICFGDSNDLRATIRSGAISILLAPVDEELLLRRLEQVAKRTPAIGVDSQSKPGSGKKFLVVDDERHIIALMKLNLELAGFEVATAADGIEAVERYRAFQPDVVFMDLCMPRMDGTEAIQKIIEMDPDARIISSCGIEENDHAAQAAGARDSITKPFGPTDLINKALVLMKE
ncbi:MAG: response regulator [Patescibacteria group bacterium]|jgi:CheY-like chemotaxis protein